MESLARLATRRPVAVAVMAATLVILGWIAWGKLPLDMLPDLQSPTVVVSVRSGDRPPTEMERIYGEQIEQRLFAVGGIREISQVARTGRIVATVVFSWGTDMDFALVEVEKAAGPIRSDPDVEDVLVRRFDPRQAPVRTLGLVAEPDGPSLSELRRVADRQVATALERLEGVAEARVTGGREEEVRVEVDPYKLESFDLTLSTVESRLSAANVDINAGTLEDGGKVYLVRGLARYRTPEDIADVVLRYGGDGDDRSAIRVGDVARVRLTDAEISHLVRVDGGEGVGLAVYKEAGSNTVAVSRAVSDALEGIADDLPGIRLVEVVDDAALVEDSIADVKESALIGVALAMLVLVLFLRSPGPTAIVATAVPVSLLTTLFLMNFGDRSLNIMTLGGLALGAGMLVDNAIVVVESIFRRRSEGLDLAEASARGTADVAGAIVASTMTTCAVFLPVVFVKGLAARLIAGLSFTVVVSLLASLFVAIFLIPALASWLLPRGRTKEADPGVGRTEKLVAVLLKQPLLVSLAAVLLAGSAVWALSTLGSELLPPSDPRQFSVRLVGPAGQRVESTAQAVSTVEQVLRVAAGDHLEAMLSEVGRIPEDDRTIRDEQTEENTARILVRLAAGGPSGSAIVERVAPVVAEMSGIEASWEVGASALSQALGTSGPPIEIEIAGQSLENLRSGAAEVRQALAERAQLWNVRSSFEGGPPELRVRLEQTLADGLGIDIAAVGAAIESSLDGRKVTTLALGDEERDVMLRLPGVRLDELHRIPMTTSSGARLAVGDIAVFEHHEGAREVFRRDQRRIALVTARIAPGYEYPEAMAAAREVLAEAALPGMRAELTGEEEERIKTFGELRLAGILAVVLLFMVLAGTFESLIHPLTVVMSVPLASIGVAAVLVPRGYPIGVMEALGLIVLAGVAVNDAILLVGTARRLMGEGLERNAALARAAALRLRPILMTTATTALALIPLAVGASESARLRSPLALTIIGGIVASTLGCLLVIPCIYSVLDRVGRLGRR